MDKYDILAYLDGCIRDKKFLGIETQEQCLEYAKDCIKRLLPMIDKMENDVSGKTIIGYSGLVNRIYAYIVVGQVTANNPHTLYISDLSAGQLLNGEMRRLITAKLSKIVGDKDIADQIIGGYYPVINPLTSQKEWIRTGPYSGIDGIIPLDDYISKLLMSSKGIKPNIIIFAKEKIDIQKVFAVTEATTIFENDDCKTINGLPKNLLRDMYNDSDEGRAKFFEIINITSSLAVNDINVSKELEAEIQIYLKTKVKSEAVEKHINDMAHQLITQIEGGLLSAENDEIQLQFDKTTNTYRLLYHGYPFLEYNARIVLEATANEKEEKEEINTNMDMNTSSNIDGKAIVDIIKSDNDLYNKFLKFQGTIYKHNAYVALEFFAQNPDVEFVGTAEQWNRLGYSIGLGEVGLTYTDKYGAKHEYFDYSQTIGGPKPVVWSVNAENVAYLKKELEIPENQRIIPGLLNKTITAEEIQNCAALLKVNSKNANEFKRAYLNAVQMIVAGRLEVNGADFNIKADNSFVKNLSYEQTMILLTYALLSARKALNAAEKVILNYNEQERIKNNESNIQTVDDINRKPETEHSERGLTSDSERNLDEQSDLVESDKNSRQSDNVGDNSRTWQGNENSTDTGVQEQTDTGRNNTDVPFESFDGDIRSDIESGTDSKRGTSRDLRTEVDGLHGEQLSTSYESNDSGEQVPDGSSQGRSGSTGLQGETGTGVHSEEFENEGIRSESDFGTGEDENVGRNSNEGSSTDAETLNSISFSDPVNNETSVESADVSSVSGDLETAKQLINEFYNAENKENADFSLLSFVHLASTEDDEYGLPVQVYADLVNARIFKEFNTATVNLEQYDRLEDMIGRLRNLNYDSLIRVSDEEKAMGLEHGHEPIPAYVRRDGAIERFHSIDDAVKRFNKLRQEPYKATDENLNDTDTVRLAIGLVTPTNFDLDIVQVREEQNYFSGDLITIDTANSRFIEKVKQISDAVGIDKIRIFENKKDDNDYFLPPKDIEFNEWNNTLFKYDPITEVMVEEPEIPEKETVNNENTWNAYIIPDLSTWAISSEKNTPIERFSNLDDALNRFAELRKEPYNLEIKANPWDNSSMARLTIGLESTDGINAADIVHVRDGKNYLVDDFTRLERMNSQQDLIGAVKKIADTVGIERINVFEKDENGKFLPPKDIEFSDWNNTFFEYEFKNSETISENNDMYVAGVNTSEAFYDEDDHADDDIPEITYADNPRAKVRANLDAIETVKRIQARESYGYGAYRVSEQEKIALRGYVGWGGLSDIFDESKSIYSSERQKLKTLLTDQEYKDARSSTLNAHYTSQVVIDAMYKAINNMDLPREARILEPACGTGNFITRLPVKFRDASVVAVELDGITAKIADYLNEDNENITVINSGFEKTELTDNSFDLAIGNVPFGNYDLVDPAHKDKWKIHDAFFRKALDKVASGGVVAFITSTGTLDKKNPRVREYLSQRADLIGAIRLPNNAFADAGTKTSTDIIFLQKRENPRLKGDYPDWCYTIANEEGLQINSYYIENPQMLLGKMEQTSHFNMLTCAPILDANLKEQLNKAITYLNATINVKKRDDTLNQMRGIIEPWGSNFSYQVNENGAFFRENNTMRELNLSEKEKDRLKALIDIRSATRELVDLQRTDISDEALMPKREQLNVLYEKFVEKYGPINEGKANSKIFNMDYDFPLVAALENFDKETNTYSKADIFTKRTVAPVISIEKANNIEEALQISMDQRGKIDIPYMTNLLKNVYTSENAANQIADELIQNGYAFRDPDEVAAGIPFADIREKSEYLSGNVRQKLHSAEEIAATNPEYARNVEALKEVLPEDIPAEAIGIRMGCAWIDAEDYGKFLTHLSGKDYTQCEVTYDALSGEYSVSNSNKRSGFNINESKVYGTEDVNMYKLAERILNQRRIVVQYKAVDPITGKDKTYTDAKATALALEKAKVMKNEFTKWLFSDEKRREKYERRYNDTFNCLVGRTYDGSKLTFPGMNSEFKLRPHQLNCVARTIYGGNTLAAHVVGAGKSAVIVTSVMKKKDIGLINKACVVVPKPLTEQTANEWRKIYPDARLLVVDNKDLSDETKRKLFTAKVATGSYDAVIMSNEQFEKLSMSNGYKATYIQNKIDEYEDLLRNTKANQSYFTRKSDAKTIKQIEEALAKQRVKLEAALNPVSDGKAKDKFIEFESLGFDYLVVDEAHNYKNGSIISKMENVAGVAGKASMRAEDMKMKTDYFNTKFGQGHILFATGTPVSNTMTELYVMKQYLRPDLLKAQGVARFDDWAATFGNVVTKNQQTADGRLKMKSKFASFVNLPELMAMYKEFADIQSAEKLNLPRPALKGDKIQIVKVPASPEQKEYVKQLASRAQLIELGAVSPTEDNHLTITGEARLVGLGNHAIKSLYEKKDALPSDFVVEKNSKVDKCIENVARIYKETEATKGVQIIFSDIAINNDKGNFSVYDYIRNELINEHGIPAEEIVFGPKADAKNREKIFADINDSKYRVVIASTSTLGTGANIQKNLYALHHVDIPWKPSDFTQREGRILRQGNTNKEVEIFNYVTEGTLDSYLYQTVTDKARFIAQLMDNQAPARVSEDCDEKVLTYAEIQAAAEGNPDFKRRIELSNEIAELTMLRNEYYRETAAVKSKLKDYPNTIAMLKTNIEKCKADIVSASKIKDALTVTTHDGKVLTESKDINAYLLKEVTKSAFALGKTSDTFVIGDFKVNAIANNVSYVDSTTDISFKVQGETLHMCKAAAEESSNNLLRLSNLFENGIHKRLDELNDTLNKEESDMRQSEQRVNIPFADEEKLEKLTEEFNEIEARLSGISESGDDIISVDEDAVTNAVATDKNVIENEENINEEDYGPVR